MNIDGNSMQIPSNIPVEMPTIPIDMAARKKVTDEAAPPSDKADLKYEKAAIEDKGAQITDTGPTPEVVVMREGGLQMLIKNIDEAKESIDIHIYIITANTPDLMKALKGALERGVKMRLMVEDDPFYWTEFKSNPSEKAIQELVDLGAEYKPDNPVFSKSKVTHEKSMVFDRKKALILTGNLGSTTFDKNLDLGAIVINNKKVVDQVETIFNADWDRTPLPEMEDVGLVISPDNAREKIEGFIGSAKKSIHVLQQGFSDTGVIQLLARKQEEGVNTELLLTDPGVAQYNMQSGAYLALKGAKVKFLTKNYIHAKAVSVDTEDKDKSDDRTYIGSQNFSWSAINKNRELGIIFSDKENQLDKIIQEYGSMGFDIPSKMIVSDNAVIGRSMNTAIRSAEKSVMVQTCLFSDKGTRLSLCKAAQNGIKVQVMMPQNPFPWDPNCKFNIETAAELKEAGVEVKWTDEAYKSTQGTAVVVDGKEAIVYPENISSSAFSKNVNYGIIDINPQDVGEIDKQLQADWAGGTAKASKPATLGDSEVVTSPGNARQQILNLINSATSCINIETKEVTDTGMVKALKAKAREGIPIKIIMPDKDRMSDYQKKIIKELEDAGVQIQLLSFQATSNNFIEIDKEKAYIGSHRMNKESLDTSRGFGLIATHPEMLKISHKSFGEHWVTSAIDQAENDIHLEKKFMDSNDRVLSGLLKGMAKRGVRIRVTCGNYDESAIKMEFTGLNQTLRDVAALDPDKDQEAIAKFFGTVYKPEQGLAMHKKLKEAIDGLKPGEEMLQGVQKDPNTIVRSSMEVDGREVNLVDRMKGESEDVGGFGEAAFGMLSSSPLFDELFEKAPEEFANAEDVFLYQDVMTNMEEELQ